MGTDDLTLEYQNRKLTVPGTDGLVLFEVYEASGNLLFVSSTLEGWEKEVGDYVVRRPWATAAEPILHMVVPS